MKFIDWHVNTKLLKIFLGVVLLGIAFYGFVQFHGPKNENSDVVGNDNMPAQQAEKVYYPLTTGSQENYYSNELGIKFTYPKDYYVYQANYSSSSLYLIKSNSVKEGSGADYYGLHIYISPMTAQEASLTNEQRVEKMREEIESSRDFYDPIIKQENAPQREAEIVEINGMKFIKEIEYLEGSESGEGPTIFFTLFKGSKKYEFNSGYSKREDLIKVVNSFEII